LLVYLLVQAAFINLYDSLVLVRAILTLLLCDGTTELFVLEDALLRHV